MKVTKDVRFAVIPEWVLYHPDLSGEAVRLYGVLSRYGENGENGGSIVRKAKLCERLGWSPEKLRRTLRELEASGALMTTARVTAKGQHPSEYTIVVTPPSSDLRRGGTQIWGGHRQKEDLEREKVEPSATAKHTVVETPFGPEEVTQKVSQNGRTEGKAGGNGHQKLLFGAVLKVFDLDPNAMTRSERADLGKTASELAELDPPVTKEEIEKFVRWWRLVRKMEPTHRVLRNHFSEIRTGKLIEWYDPSDGRRR